MTSSGVLGQVLSDIVNVDFVLLICYLPLESEFPLDNFAIREYESEPRTCLRSCKIGMVTGLIAG